MLNIVIPMAGAGSRFSRVGYVDPKPLIPVCDVPMIRLVIENLRPRQLHRFIFICQREHVEVYGLKERLTQWAPGCEVVQLDGLTQGAACSVLAARELIDDKHPLMIANSDQYVDIDIDHYLDSMSDRLLDGLLMTMKAQDPKWSYVGLDEHACVNQVVEKEVISDEATVGIYNFARGADFVCAAEESMNRNLRVNGEFYVAPVYNILIERGQRIGICNIGEDRKKMYGLGTPTDLEFFLDCPLSRDVAGALL